MKSSRIPFLRAAAALAVVLASLSGPSPALGDDGSESAKKVNINQASATQIAYLPRIGAKAADRIVEYRKAHGSFGKAEELMEVKGVGERRYADLKPYIALSGPTTLTAKVRSTGSGARRAASKKSASTASNSVPVGKGR
ncbi:MAG TPA: helix-hairpin-helix domain-containing protein [Thermoanaerobaculia bacterium]|nr:helix-hairpin-helix domain-containing protein [Thermoanaerobaculia bacterium]